MSLYQQLQQKPFLIAGPCVLENEAMALDIAFKVKEIADKLGFTYIFKASYDKANRTSIHSFRGLGLEKGLEALANIKAKVGVPVITDVHETIQVPAAAQVADVLQIPAFLCRQTDLLVACGESGRIINVKKGQFLSAKEMQHVAKKIQETGNSQILLCERGTTFGYNTLVVDYTGLVEMRKFGFPVVMDATHAVQKPGGMDGKSGGNREYVPYVAKAAAAVGVKGFFFETHPNPDAAPSDGPNMVYLDKFEEVLSSVKNVMDAVR